MITDIPNALTFATLRAPLSSATNNAASAGLDIRDYIGVIAVRVALGVKTAGDNDGAVTVTLQAAANNVASEATTLTTANGLLGTANNVATTNNTAASGVLAVDADGSAVNRYLFARIVLAGTNSPAYPIAIEVVGRKQVQ